MADLSRYCLCGAAMRVRSEPATLADRLAAEFDARHDAEGCGPTTAVTAARARTREERAVLREPEGGGGCYALTNAGRGLECGIHGKACSFARQGGEPEGGDRT